jgi:hypothetical protein
MCRRSSVCHHPPPTWRGSHARGKSIPSAHQSPALPSPQCSYMEGTRETAISPQFISPSNLASFPIPIFVCVDFDGEQRQEQRRKGPVLRQELHPRRSTWIPHHHCKLLRHHLVHHELMRSIIGHPKVLGPILSLLKEVGP